MKLLREDFIDRPLAEGEDLNTLEIVCLVSICLVVVAMIVAGSLWKNAQCKRVRCALLVVVFCLAAVAVITGMKGMLQKMDTTSRISTLQ